MGSEQSTTNANLDADRKARCNAAHKPTPPDRKTKQGDPTVVGVSNGKRLRLQHCARALRQATTEHCSGARQKCEVLRMIAGTHFHDKSSMRSSLVSKSHIINFAGSQRQNRSLLDYDRRIIMAIRAYAPRLLRSLISYVSPVIRDKLEVFWMMTNTYPWQLKRTILADCEVAYQKYRRPYTRDEPGHTYPYVC